MRAASAGTVPGADEQARGYFHQLILRVYELRSRAIWIAWAGVASIVLGLAFSEGTSVISHVLLAGGAMLTLVSLHLGDTFRSDVRSGAPDLEKLTELGRRIDKRIEQLEDARWQLRDNNQRLRDLLDAQEDVIMRRDANGRLTFVNRAFCTRFGIKPEDVLGSDFSPAELTVAGKPVDGSTDADQSHRADEAAYIETADGPRWYAWRQKQIPAHDGMSNDTLMIGRDVTAQHRHEMELADARDAAEAASRAKSRFLAAMSHEIRTPMNGIMGMSGLLLESELTPNQHTYVSAVDQSARTLLALIDEILDFSRIEADRLVLNPVPFSIAECIQSVVELLAPRAHDKDLEIAWSLAPNVPGQLVGDEVRIRQILMNLVGNAIKFTDRGGVTVKLEAQAVEAHGCRLKLTITDTGIGIAPDAIVNIFGEFERADADHRRSETGTGLGLAIALRLARAMGGDIKVSSAPGRGATFAVELDLPTLSEDAAPWIEPSSDIAGMTVVLAFDNLVERRLMAAMLRDYGVTVIEADDPDTAADAEQLASSEMTVDLFMVSADEDPVYAGRALDRIRRQTNSPTTKGIILAGSSDRSGWAKFRACGFDHHLVSPVRPRSLFAQLTKQPKSIVACRQADEVTGLGDCECCATQGARALRVLLAEDNDINALLAQTMLAKSGCNTTRARDGRAAVDNVLEAIEEGQPFDLVLMDLHMPEIDGIAATQEIRRACANQGIQGPAIVAVTANAFPEDRDRCLAAGMDDYLAKPFDRAELDEMVARRGFSAA